jgi:hypothetical protein
MLPHRNATQVLTQFAGGRNGAVLLIRWIPCPPISVMETMSSKDSSPGQQRCASIE